MKPPPGIPDPPEGFVYFGLGPLVRPDPTIGDYSDVAHFDTHFQCWRSPARGRDSRAHYALRIGSEIAKANGLDDVGTTDVIDSGFPALTPPLTPEAWWEDVGQAGIWRIDFRPWGELKPAQRLILNRIFNAARQ